MRSAHSAQRTAQCAYWEVAVARLHLYLSENEVEFVKRQKAGWLRSVVQREMTGLPAAPAAPEPQPTPPVVVPVAPAPREPADSDQFGRPHCKNCGAVLTIKEKCLVCGAKQ